MLFLTLGTSLLLADKVACCVWNRAFGSSLTAFYGSLSSFFKDNVIFMLGFDFFSPQALMLCFIGFKHSVDDKCI